MYTANVSETPICENCGDEAIEEHLFRFCFFCGDEHEELEELERIDQEEQRKKAKAAGVPISRIDDMLDLIHF